MRNKQAIAFLGLNPISLQKGFFLNRKPKKAHGMVDKIIELILYIALIVAAGAAVWLLVSKIM